MGEMWAEGDARTKVEVWDEEESQTERSRA